MAGQDDFSKTLVIDFGTGITKAGIADVERGARLIPSVYSDTPEHGKLFASDALSRRKTAPLQKFTDRDQIKDFPAAKEFISYIYNKELKTNPATQFVLFGATNLDSKFYKEKLLTMFLEDFRALGFYTTPNTLLSLYGSGRLQGIVLDAGESNITVGASQEGLLNEHQQIQVNVGGTDIDAYIKKELNGVVEDSEYLKNIKHNKCRGELKKAGEVEKETIYTLPDESTVTINSNIIHAPDILFNPNKINVRGLGLHELVYECTMLAEYDARRDLLANLVVSGGCFNIPDLSSTLAEKVNNLFGGNQRARVDDSEDKQSLSWIGGAIVSSLATFQSNWITRSHLEEYGPSIILRKCL